MAVVKCDKCNLTYDDTYRLTYCPHDKFEMSTVVSSGGRVLGVATSVEEFHRLLRESFKDPFSKNVFKRR